MQFVLHARPFVVAAIVGVVLSGAGCDDASPPCSGVQVPSGNSIQQHVDSHPTGTTFCLSGTYTGTVRPKQGQRFFGPAVFDGANNVTRAFVGNARSVTIGWLEIRNYSSPLQVGAIDPDLSAAGWVLIELNVHHNYGAGISTANGMRVLGGKVNHQGQLGIAGRRANDVVIDGTEIAYNNTRNTSCQFEAGGYKWVGERVTVRDAWVHHNRCKGLWSDIDGAGAIIENNLIEDNDHEGIFYEISHDGVIRNNTVRRNGFKTNGTTCAWLWGGGITIASSDGVEIYGNRLENNCNGITGTQQDREGHVLDRIHVRDNHVTGGGRSGVVEDNDANLDARDIVFESNTWSGGHRYCSTNC